MDAESMEHFYTIRYDDGDMEHLTTDEVATAAKNAVQQDVQVLPSQKKPLKAAADSPSTSPVLKVLMAECMALKALMDKEAERLMQARGLASFQSITVAVSID